MPREIAIIFAAALPVLLYSFILFDRIVAAGYIQDRLAWESAGKPRGFFWSKPECSYIGSSFARNRLSLVWLFQGPAWAAENPTCANWLMRLRICVLIWNIMVVFIAIHLISHLR
jgi:hypothetical protein